MATFFSSPPFLSNPLARANHFSSSSQTPPPNRSPIPPSESQSSTPSAQPSLSSSQQPAPVSVKVQQQKPITPTTKVETTDWIASTLTRRFGLGAGLAWAGFLAVGVISEQIKTRLEISQQEANTRNVEKEEEVVLPNGIRYSFSNSIQVTFIVFNLPERRKTRERKFVNALALVILTHHARQAGTMN
uniref:Peptidyl-prolyl cis-trans isomerase FKBP17-2ic-like isoform X2 n=1 Tax=Rhizophora mucronata TaxID=61149 RepID=A0A2P2JE67_RHIMU